QMFADTRFGDFPHYLPTKKWENPSELFTGWMLLSYRKPVMVSSALDTFPARNITDENPRTFWVAARNAADQWVRVDLEREHDLRALQVNYVDYKSNIYGSETPVYTQFRVSASRDGISWTTIADLTPERRDRPNAYVELPAPVRARYLRYEHVHSSAPNLAISDIRVFGNGSGKPPSAPGRLSVRRDSDARNAFVTWEKSPGAIGYNVLWGIAPNKLYQTYQRFHDEDPLEIRALTVGQEYYFAIEAFNENGVSRRTGTVHLK
ncbi:MAG TPA: discoidin domain-containing protein, partial [Gemmatimonadaceae bacterium]|nr:discoidin domain-containing protein [Gemmatimonadaceae bacterium]